jgi:hypothetical protein
MAFLFLGTCKIQRLLFYYDMISFFDFLKQIHIKSVQTHCTFGTNTLPSDVSVGMDVNVQILSRTWPHRHKSFGYPQENCQLKYLSLIMSLASGTFSNLSMYWLKILSASPISYSDI